MLDINMAIVFTYFKTTFSLMFLIAVLIQLVLKSHDHGSQIAKEKMMIY